MQPLYNFLSLLQAEGLRVFAGMFLSPKLDPQQNSSKLHFPTRILSLSNLACMQWYKYTIFIKVVIEKITLTSRTKYKWDMLANNLFWPKESLGRINCAIIIIFKYLINNQYYRDICLETWLHIMKDNNSWFYLFFHYINKFWLHYNKKGHPSICCIPYIQ